MPQSGPAIDHEEVPTVDQISRYGAARIDSATGAVLIDEANRHVANAISEASKGEPEPAERILTQRLRRVAAAAVVGRVRSKNALAHRLSENLDDVG